MDIYLLLFLIIIFSGSIISYIYYLNDKASQLNLIQKGICPICKENSIELTDQRGGGCGPKLITFQCNKCNYENSFSIDNSSCGL